MLRIRFDHRPERLADALLDSFADLGPLEERVVLVPSAGVGRWLQQRDARRHGITARIRPEFSGRWLWQTMRVALDRLPAQSPFEAERVRWHLLALFDEFPDGEGFALPAQRIGEAGSVARLRLADAMARCFERYLAWRRDGLARWQQGGWWQGDGPCGPHEVWQRWLWNRLLGRLAEVQVEHPYDAFVRLLTDGDPARIGQALEERAPGAHRIALFGRIDLSPEQFALFGLLSRQIDVSFFAPDPCRELWTDLLDSASLARAHARRPDLAWLYEGEPAILGNWGRAQRDFIAQLQDLEERFGIQAEAPGRDEGWPFAAGEGVDGGIDASVDGEIDACVEADGGASGAGRQDDAAPAVSALSALQAAVFLRSDEVWTGRHLRADPSIRVSGACGIVREAEILHEALLECFVTLPDLKPDDIVVQCADLERAAPVISGVFAGVPPARRIPVRISGLARAADDLLLAVQQLLAAAVSGVSLASLQELFGNPAILAATGLDRGQALQLLAALDRAGARCGLDAADGAPKHNLRSAIDRLLLGAATGMEGSCVDLYAVPALSGSRVDVIGALLRVIDALECLDRLAVRPHAPRHWCAALIEVVETLFAALRSHAASLQQLREALERIATLSDAAPAVVLDAAAFARAVSDAIDQAVPAAVPTGAVTIVPMGSLRGVPFRVICLFGFDEGAFPRRGMRDELDLLPLTPRFGDRLARHDDRAAFLDAVLAARERLLISCVSRDARDGSARNPSPLVAELLLYLSARMQPDRHGAGAGSLLRVDRSQAPLPCALIEYPLHPFSRAGFEGAGADRASEWLETARVAVTPLIARVNEIGGLGTADGRSLRAGFASRRLDGGTDDGFRGEDAAGSAEEGAEGSVALPGPAPGDSVPIDYLCRALSDPAGVWLHESLGLRRDRYRVIDEDRPAPQFEPLWPESANDARILSSWVRRLLCGVDEARLLRQLAAAPYTVAAPAAAIEARALLAQARALIGRALDGAALVPAAEDAVPVVVRVGDLRLRMTPPARDAQGHLLFISSWNWQMSALIDAWLRTALWRFAVDRSATGRLVFASDDEPVVFQCADPLRSLTHAITWTQRIIAQPVPLFPRSWLAYARARRKGRGAEREINAMRAGSNQLLGDDHGFARAEIERAEMRALYRDAKPEFSIVLPMCESVYRPVFDDSSLAAASPS